ncbi:DUF4136 domain-containing protein [Robertkochia sediminum]|uniref:hypothetical protein n=1 Tax=Robertkochia sediminum TaxID=2785326 RepID=UPI00193331C6|nr:hypothetical protein [Robertkochia sediminum]MBL7472109.1 hypothetical protein [Robertkochia sediminum]
MKKLLIITICLFSTSLIFAQKSVYQSNSFEILSKDHKTLAILPFATRLEMENSGNSESAMLKNQKIHEGYVVQQALEQFFLQRDKKKDYRVEFQNVENTNALLKQAGVTTENLDIKTTQELSNILGVDGVISGDLVLNRLLSQGVDTTFNFIDYISGKSNYGRITIKLSDGATGKLLWRFEQVIDRKSGKNTTAIIDKMMRQSTRKFPYRKE